MNTSTVLSNISWVRGYKGQPLGKALVFCRDSKPVYHSLVVVHKRELRDPGVFKQNGSIHISRISQLKSIDSVVGDCVQRDMDIIRVPELPKGSNWDAYLRIVAKEYRRISGR